MSSRARLSAYRTAVLAVAAASLAGCAARTPTREPVRLYAPAPRLTPTPPVEQLAPLPLNLLSPSTAPESERRVSFSATDADLRSLIHMLSEAAGLAAVVSPEVQGKVTVDFRNVTAREALQLLLEQSGVASSANAVRPPWPPVVFYRIPANIRDMSAEAIQTHFSVSREIAEMVVRMRQR